MGCHGQDGQARERWDIFLSDRSGRVYKDHEDVTVEVNKQDYLRQRIIDNKKIKAFRLLTPAVNYIINDNIPALAFLVR